MSTVNTNHSDESQKTIRMPAALCQRIACLAKKKRRSFNAQAVIVLEHGIGPAEQEDASK